MASPPAYLLLLLSLPFLAAAQSPAPAPSPSTPPSERDPINILKLDGRFSILLALLAKADLVGLIRLQPTIGGLTLFAPTDNAFMKVAATLGKLSEVDRTTTLLYHCLYTYVSFRDLALKGGPIETLASGLPLNFTTANGRLIVSTGVVYTEVGALYDNYPLNIFVVEDVLIPAIFAAGPVAPPPPGSVPAAPGRRPRGVIAPPPSLGARLGRVGWGSLILGVLNWRSFSV